MGFTLQSQTLNPSKEQPMLRKKEEPFMKELQQVRNVEQLVALSREGAAPKYLYFWGHQAGPGSAVSKSCFSQWYEAPFIVEGVSYASAEHFMMAEKARVFADQAVRERVLSARSPAEAKALGRQVKGFADAVWNEVRFAIVVAANEAKFSQNPELRAFLLSTGDRVLVEASPVDPVWGIGLAADHVDASIPERWQGLNLLGFALMEVRSRLSRIRI